MIPLKTQQLISLLQQSGIPAVEKDGAIVIGHVTDAEVVKARQICESFGKVFDVSNN